MYPPGSIWQCGIKQTDTKLQTLQDEKTTSALENNIPGGNSSVMVDRFVISNDVKKCSILMKLIYMVGL